MHQWLAANYCIDFAGDASIMIVGSGRSGTSWLANLCNYQNTFRYIFEPLNPAHCEDKISSWSPAPDDLSAVLASALEGRNISKWSKRLNRKVWARQRLIKEIRLNLALDWVKKNYPSIKIVKIVRNPLAVAASKKSLNLLGDAANWEWKPSLSELINDVGVRAKITPEQHQKLAACVGQGQVIETVADWCLNNLIVHSDVYTIWYEKLCRRPVEELEEVFDYLQIPLRASLTEQIEKPSHTFRMFSGDQDFEESEHRWKKVLTGIEIERAVEVLEYFEVGQLYTRDWQPVVSKGA